MPFSRANRKYWVPVLYAAAGLLLLSLLLGAGWITSGAALAVAVLVFFGSFWMNERTSVVSAPVREETLDCRRQFPTALCAEHAAFAARVGCGLARDRDRRRSPHAHEHALWAMGFPARHPAHGAALPFDPLLGSLARLLWRADERLG